MNQFNSFDDTEGLLDGIVFKKGLRAARYEKKKFLCKIIKGEF